MPDTIWWTEREPREARIRDALARGERHQRTDPTSMVIATLPLIDLRHLVAERDALRAQLADVLAENDAARFQLNNALAALREAGHD